MEDEIKRGPGRPSLRDKSADLRPEMHAEDPRELARVRAAQILENMGDIDEHTDEFWIDPALIPDGWDWNWKRYTVVNEPQGTYINELRRRGWDFVSAKKYPQLVPIGWKEEIVLRKGNVLMERPAEISRMISQRDLHNAKLQVDTKAAQVEGIDPSFSRENRGNPIVAKGVSGVRKSYSPMPVPD